MQSFPARSEGSADGALHTLTTGGPYSANIGAGDTYAFAAMAYKLLMTAEEDEDNATLAGSDFDLLADDPNLVLTEDAPEIPFGRSGWHYSDPTAFPKPLGDIIDKD
ncbi:hypothetical protein EHS25_000921 [Saitozyma podzolica]|uniref:Uncharacterized protein n=1 Tax=Saitozyma podzolica TaxID=1890683 RepID=A0A427YXL4_9TREE|nr:hypothetical protein EHS25_000921 [Saitozyma podzolica]